MKDVLIRHVPDEVVERLKRRADRAGRSLQQELLRLLVREAAYSPEAFVEQVRERQQRYAEDGTTFPDSTGDIRQDRERR